jgi:hypothetical protein
VLLFDSFFFQQKKIESSANTVQSECESQRNVLEGLEYQIVALKGSLKNINM